MPKTTATWKVDGLRARRAGARLERVIVEQGDAKVRERRFYDANAIHAIYVANVKRYAR